MFILIFAVVFFASPQQAPPTQLTGVYRIDLAASDKLYSVVAGASSKVPFRDQQRFFIDLAVRFTPPDLLAIEQRGRQISLGSSRASKMTFLADGIARTTRAADGHTVRMRFAVEGNKLVFTSSGKTEDNFSIVFESLDDGRRLRVVRRIEAEGLDQPLVIQSVYNKVSDVARWELYGETQTASVATTRRPESDREPIASAVSNNSSADVLRQALIEWIDATNKRDISKQMTFYVPRLRAYYLTRNTPSEFVRDEKQRVFATATLIDVRAEEPEIIFQDGGQAAIMRYKKRYRIDNGRRSRSGQVIQELRWQRTAEGWRIFSERDIRVLAR